jgi:outer membrane receptor protein involved in Fe transport
VFALHRLSSPTTRWLFVLMFWFLASGADAQAVGAQDAGGVADAGNAADTSGNDASSLSLDAADAVEPSSLADAAAPPVAVVPPAAAAPAAAAGSDLPAGAKRPTATLRGRVISALDEVGIEGANVYVRGESYEAHADSSGEFALPLPTGTYQVTAIFPGYSTLSISKVEVRTGQNPQLEFKLQPGSVELEEMVVTGTRIKGGIATLIAERRQATAVADVIGAEQMSRSGDSNAATALSRVTGITVIDGRYVLVRGMGERYSSMLVNRLQVPSPEPTRRVVPLDIFPAGVIDSVVVQKTYSPDLPGEFGGGMVQLRSREYPHNFVFNVNAATGGNVNTVFQERLSYRGGKYDYLGIDDGVRDIPKEIDESDGKLVPANIADPEGYSEEELAALGRTLRPEYEKTRETAWPDLTLGASVGNEFRLRYAKIGFVAAAGYRSEYRFIDDMVLRRWQDGQLLTDYKVDQHRRQISLAGFLDWGVEFSAQHKLKFTTMILRQTDDTTQVRVNQDVQADKRTTLSWVERQIVMQQVSGFHTFKKLANFHADWRYAFGQAVRLEPDRRQYLYKPAEDGVEEMVMGSNNHFRLFGSLKDNTHEAALDLAQPIGIWKHLEMKVKAGGVFYRRDRTADSRTFEFIVRSPEIDRAQSPNVVLGRDNIGAGVEFNEVTRPTDSYNAYMQLEGGYAMLELPIVSAFDITGGARIEHAYIETNTFDPFDPNGMPVTANLDNRDVLPAATATLRLPHDLQVRAGYGRTLNRPDFRELADTRYFDLETNLLWVGNPDIKRASIENFDARFEWYYTPDEVFSVSGFLKLLDDPIENAQVAGAEEIYTVRNAAKGTIYGLELEGRKRFSFIAKVLKPLYVAANFSLIRSEAEIAVADTDMDGMGSLYYRPLQGQSPWVINAQLGWDDAVEGGTGTAASLVFNSAGRRIRIVGSPEDNTGDTYEEPVHRLDFVVSQDLPHKLKIGGRVRNMLNPKEVWTVDGDVARSFRRGADFQISLAWSY